MIVRGVLDNPGLARSMDLFNDGRDTVQWLRSLVPENGLRRAVIESLADEIERRTNDNAARINVMLNEPKYQQGKSHE